MWSAVTDGKETKLTVVSVGGQHRECVIHVHITKVRNFLNVIFQHPVALYRSNFWSFCAVYVQRCSLFERLWWPTNTQQNSHPSKNIQGSHNQQTKQNQKQKQPPATQGHPNKTDGNPHNQNNQRQLTTTGGKKTALQWAAESLTITTCTPEDGQLGQNM
jgi:hypothetical protein